MSTELSIPQAVQPKPTKKQILDALIERAKFLHEEREASKLVKHQEVTKLIEEEALKIAAKQIPEIFIYSYRGIGSHCDARINNIQSAKLERLFKQHEETKEDHFNYSEVKAQLQRKLDATASVVQQLLTNQTFIQAADQLIESK